MHAYLYIYIYIYVPQAEPYSTFSLYACAQFVVCSCLTPTARVSGSDRKCRPFRLYCVGASLYSSGHAPASYVHLPQTGMNRAVPQT